MTENEMTRHGPTKSLCLRNKTHTKRNKTEMKWNDQIIFNLYHNTDAADEYEHAV